MKALLDLMRFGALLVLLSVVLSCTEARQFVGLSDNSNSRDTGAAAIQVASTSGPPPFPLVARYIRDQLRSDGGMAELVQFLTDHIRTYPDDPVNSHYLVLLGDLYQKSSADQLALNYYRRALGRYPSIEVDGTPSHLTAIQGVLATTDLAEEKVRMYQTLLQNYEDHIDVGRTHWKLAKAYESTGQWELAYQSYRDFLRYPETTIPGHPHAIREVQQKLAFYDSDRNWTRENLDELVDAIKYALWTQNTNTLLAYRARDSFFTMSWEQEEADANSQIRSFDIGAFLRRSRVRFAEDLDLASNAREAYLRTWGWSHRIPTWYLYFRRVDFPADPDINGNWEWGGIYFGDAL